MQIEAERDTYPAESLPVTLAATQGPWLRNQANPTA